MYILNRSKKEMPSTIGRRNLHLSCFTNIKRPVSSSSSPTSPKQDHSRPLSNSTSLIMKNFNSLYNYNHSFESNTNYSNSPTTDQLSSSGDGGTTPDFSTVFASRRFFFSSPGRSNSITECTSPSTSSSPGKPPDYPLSGGIAIPTYSPDPFRDFRRSMQEMVEARDLVDVRANWDYLHELLLCYLALNPKSTHKVIVGAFADLLVSLVSAESTAAEEADDGGRISDFSGGSCSF